MFFIKFGCFSVQFFIWGLAWDFGWWAVWVKMGNWKIFLILPWLPTIMKAIARTEF